MSKKKGFNARGFVSLLIAGGFLVMMVTGVLLYIVPPGRVANWVDWSMFGLTKEQWGTVHITSSILFMGAAIYHLILNWKPFLNYVAGKIRGGNGTRKLRSEGLVATVVVAFIVAGSIGEIPPFTWVMDANDYIKNSWSTGVGGEPPFGHAEEVSVKSLASKTRIDAKAAVVALTDAGYTVAGPEETLREIADNNGTNPASVYTTIRAGLKKAEPQDIPASLTPEKISELYSGTGVGRKTVAQIADDFDLEPATALSRLAAAGFQATKDDRMKDLAGADYEPMALLSAVLIDGFVPKPAE